MNGRMTLLCLLLAVAVGFGLFQVKHRVQALEEEWRSLNAELLREQERLHVLNAEWAHLNRPSRLEALNASHLHLGPMKAGQAWTSSGPGAVTPALGAEARAFGGEDQGLPTLARLPMRPEKSPDIAIGPALPSQPFRSEGQATDGPSAVAVAADRQEHRR